MFRKSANTLLVYASLLGSLPIFAGSHPIYENAPNKSEYFKAILENDWINEFQKYSSLEDISLSKIELKETLRCPGCYIFEVILEGYVSNGRIRVPTKMILECTTKLNVENYQIDVKF